jgi:hypothetical protein
MLTNSNIRDEDPRNCDPDDNYDFRPQQVNLSQKPMPDPATLIAMARKAMRGPCACSTCKQEREAESEDAEGSR